MFPEFSMWNIKVSTVNIFWLGIYKKALCSQCCEVWGVTGNWISAQGLEELVEHLSIWYNNLDICHFSPQTTHLGQFCHQKYIDKIICLHLIWIVSMTDLSPRTLSTASVTDISCANNNGWQYMNLLWCHSVFNSDTIENALENYLFWKPTHPILNIARDTTDPGYWVSDLNYLVDQIEFVTILDNSSFRLNYLGLLCHHLNWLQIWPPDGATCIDCKFGHKMAPHALVSNFPTRLSHLH